ncbi:pleiotropic drug resistance 5-like isoform A [Micractinium conductrix]|uniref:Pleiotropic drug resistance 5-like isoform A n=1 Tax=Micractinium conductrix TaxID=554055 RepID=A0A2P6VN97_9CHLO|nr:pleiotropic drug resistance 5-like isoform A [Micractinium conductrix]|eukprot:PSC75525.1 pleiotropic drug resistance 5-like isoform A [Micractinium conductrix]
MAVAKSPALGPQQLHGQSEEARAARDEERREAEELAAAWRGAARSASELATALLEAPAGEGEESVPDWLQRRFQELGIKLPSITVTYQGLSVETDAAVGAAGIPTVARWLGAGAVRAAGRRVLGGGGGGGAPRTRCLTILRGAQGVLRPGRLTLLLGPPGAGKSTLLQTLGGQLKPSKRLRIEGDVRYNGQPASQFDLQRTAAYVDQYDVHLPLLTVRETLEFARSALWLAGCKHDLSDAYAAVLAKEGAEVGVSVLPKELQDDLVKLMSSPELEVEFTLRLLGLEGCADTVVGDAMIRGISGGQKRRLTCGELLVGGRELLLLDEISTGLDSATTLTVVRYLGELARTMRCTTVVSLLQPSGDVLALFDELLLLAGGHVLFHGPVDAALPFFASQGFDCPPRMEAPAFLQYVTSASGQRQVANAALAPRLAGARSTQLLVQLAEIEAAYWGAAEGAGAEMRAAIQAAAAPEAHADLPKALVQESDVAPWWSFFALCTRRQFKLLLRDQELLQGRLFQVVLAGFVVGTLFVQIPVELASSSKFLGAMFTSVAMLAFISMPLTGTVFAHKPAFIKHRALRFYPPSAFGGAFLAQELPMMLVCSALFSILVYFTAGLATTAGGFFMFWAQLLGSGLVFGAMFIALAAILPTLQVTGGLAGGVLLVLILLSGFCIMRPSIPGCWALRGVTMNEFLDGRWDFVVSEGVQGGMRAGDAVLESVGMFSAYRWVWGGLAFLAGAYLLLGALVCAAFAATPHPSKVATVGEEEEGAPAEEATSKDVVAVAAAAEAGATGKGGAAGSDCSDAKADRDAGEGAQTAALDIPFAPITLAFKDISYFVPKPSWSKAPESERHAGNIQLLHNVSGVVRPGQLACLMGASGAGKTTLLDVLAGRKTQGTIEGEVRLNGHLKEEGVWRRVSAYVEQTDIHTETATVREALLFSARLRLPASVPDADVASYVDSVLELVELQPQRHSLVGAGGGDDAGLSLEQRKRLSIAVELVASPAVLFMDEPTSGLDGHAAAVVMRVARSVANLQRTIICTIHQPSAEIFYAFDVLVLLQTGGRMMYFGELGHEARDLIAYFSSAGVRNIEPGENPASWMLDVAGGSAAGGHKGPDFVALYASSDLLTANQQTLAAACEPSGPAPAAAGGTYAASAAVQLRQLLGRQATRLWRLPSYSALRLAVAVAFALVLGTLYWNKGQIRPGTSATDAMGVMSLLFVALSNLGAINMQSVLVVANSERTVLYREQAAGMYSPLMYVSAAALVELPWVALQVCLFLPITYFMAGFRPEAGAFFFMLMVFYLAMLIYTFFGQMCLYLSPNIMAAQAMSATLAGFFDVFNGFFIAKNLMGWWWRWFWYINPASWMAYAAAANQLAGEATPIISATGEPTTVSAFLADSYGYQAGMAWPAVAILLGFIVLFRAVSAWAVTSLNWSSR